MNEIYLTKTNNCKSTLQVIINNRSGDSRANYGRCGFKTGVPNGGRRSTLTLAVPPTPSHQATINALAWFPQPVRELLRSPLSTLLVPWTLCTMTSLSGEGLPAQFVFVKIELCRCGGPTFDQSRIRTNLGPRR